MSGKRMSRREMLRELGVAFAGTALAACAPQTVVVKETVEVEKEKIIKETVVVKETVEVGPSKFEGVTLRVNCWWDQASMQPVLDAFNAHIPEIEVKLEPLAGGQWHDKLLTQLAAGTGADVGIMSGQYAPAFWSNKAGLPLDPYLERDGIDRSKFAIDPAIDGGWDGVTYAISQWFPDAATIWVNVDLFDEAGIEVPKYGTEKFLKWTWDDYLEAAKAMTKRTSDGKAEQWGLNYWQGGFWSPHRHFVWTNGGEFTDDPDARKPTKTTVTDDLVVEAYQFMADLYLKDQVSMGPAESELFSEGAYLSGKVAMTHGWNVYGTMAKSPFEWTVLPDPIRKKVTNHYAANHWMINPGSKVPDAGWEWIKFCTINLLGRLAMSTFGPIASYDPEGQLPYAKDEGQSVLWNTVVARGAAAKRDEGAYRPYFMCNEGNNEFYDAMEVAMDRIILEEMPVRQALQGVADQIDPILQG